MYTEMLYSRCWRKNPVTVLSAAKLRRVNENAVSEPTVVRRIRRRREFALACVPGNRVVLVPCVAVLSGRNASGQQGRGRASSQGVDRGHGRDGERLRAAGALHVNTR